MEIWLMDNRLKVHQGGPSMGMLEIVMGEFKRGIALMRILETNLRMPKNIKRIMTTPAMMTMMIMMEHMTIGNEI
jgi:hypothetical protein